MKHAIPDDWDHETFCRFAICWPDSTQWRALLRGLVTEPGRGFFWDEKTGWIKDVLSDFRQTMDYNIELREVIMACGDTGLKELAAAIRLLAANQCCDGGVPSNGGIQFTVNVGGVDIPVFGTQPPIDLPESGKPEDYPGTVEEYDADKCRTAAKIINDAIFFLRNLSTIQWAVNTVSIGVVIACFVGLISVPLVLIPGLIAVCIGLVGINAITAAEADWIEDHKQEWICALYEHSTVAAIIAAIQELTQVMIASLSLEGAAAYAAKVIINYTFTTDALNNLFTLVQGYGPEADCSNCGCILFTPIFYDTYEINNDEFSAVSRNAGGGRWDVEVYFHMPVFVQPCEGPVTISGISVNSGAITGEGPGSGFMICRTYDGEGNTTYQSETAIVETPVVTQAITLTSTQQFSVTITVQP